MKNDWTGGQYSVFRAVFGVYLAMRFARLIPWGEEVFSNQGVLPDASASPLAHAFLNILTLCDAPIVVTLLLLAAVLLSVLFAAGIADRAAAILLWYISACLFGRNPLISNPSLPFVGWMLLAHACIPLAPFGSWRARRRINPGGDWHYPALIFVAAWIVMSLGYAYGGITKFVSPSWINGTAMHHVLCNPLARPTLLREALLELPPWILTMGTWSALTLELAFAPLALSRHLRPIVWLLMLMMHGSLLILIDFAELSMGMILLHFFTFDPAWIRRAHAGETETIFYDGHCGLCHSAVRFVLAEERGDSPGFRFAPLQGATFDSAFPPSRHIGLPDSVVVLTADERILCRSAAVLHILARLGGLWRVLAWIGTPLPRTILDWAYDSIARARRRLFKQPVDACPMLPPTMRDRFSI